MSQYTDTYYARTVPDDTTRPALQEQIETDVCIIGGGLAGLNVALGLAERGKKAVILEGRRIGWGASGRNGGKALTGYAGGMDKMIKRTGLAQARELYGLTREALKLIRRRIDAFKIDCELEDGVMICSWYDDAAGMKAEGEEEVAELGLRVDFVPREKLRDIYVTKRYYDGLFYPDYFHLQPLKYARGIARAFEARGGRIFEDTMALHVSEDGGRVVIKTAQGTVRADHVVYCGSAYANNVEPRLVRAAVRVSSYMMVTESLPEEKLLSAIRARYGVYDTRWALDYYRILPDNRILWGGGVGIGNARLPHDVDRRLLGALLKVYPQLAGTKVDNAWVGTMASTVHRLPHIGRFSENTWYCTNFGNNGIGPTTAGGEVIASAIAEGSETWKLFEPFGLDYAGGFLGPYVAQGIYRRWQLRDKIKQWKQERRASI